MHWSKVLSKVLRSPIKDNYLISGNTTMGIGGYAEHFVEPHSKEDIVSILKTKTDLDFPLYIIGGGSNLIIRQGSIRGLFLSTRKLSDISVRSIRENFLFEVQAGVSVSNVLKKAFSVSAEGLEYLVGIPGTIGGAISGNAGGKGYAISNNISWIESIEPDGSFRRWDKNEIEWNYRFCSLSSDKRIITRAGLKLSHGNADTIRTKTRTFWEIRKDQPYNYKSAGCIFKNPEGYSAGKLLDECGCKGLKSGEAMISMKHANFIINLGSADYSDVLNLIGECRSRVLDRTGLDLELEVRLIDA